MGVLSSRLTGERYRLVAALAKGGMGEVFVGESLGPERRRVAIKTLLPEASQDRVALGRFLDEARLSARLDHPNIARLLDFGEAAGRPFGIFELLEGADVGDCLDQLIERRGLTPPEVALCIAIEACRGLHHAHTLEKDGAPLEVVHRDISPSNLFLTRTGQVKVLDFGAAWGRDRLTRTATGMIIGKLEYMPPEQVKGERLDARSDVFALGLCLHEALALSRPYQSANERELVKKIYYAEVPDLRHLRPGLPEGLYAALDRATDPDPERRFESAAAFAQALEPVLRGITRAPVEEILGRFYRNCFGAARDERRAARLKELLARPVVDADAFAWAAPELSEVAPAIDLQSEEIEVVGTPQPARGDEPDTEKEPAPLDPPQAAPPRRTATRPAYLPYAVIGGVVLLALVAGLVIGRLAALH